MRIIAVSFALFCALTGFYFALDKGFENPYPLVCNLVAEKIYLGDSQIKNWYRLCLRRARLVKVFSPNHLIIKDLNNTFGTLNVSHLEVFDASQVQSIWRGEDTETGIESEFIDSELVIFKVHKSSPAEAAGLKMGDIIHTINGEHANSWEARRESGLYKLTRQGKDFQKKIVTKEILRTENPSVEKRGRDAVLKVPSFRAEFFEEDKLTALTQELQEAQRIVLDLRGNTGGNFVAGLRLLSLFLCTPQEVGHLDRTRSKSSSEADLPNILADEEQLKVFDSHRRVTLKTYPVDKCLNADLRVLIDGKTSSVAEMVAQALKEIRKSPVRGLGSQGQLLVGIWYPLPEIGPGVQISIPEAIYVSLRGYNIEGHGVEVDKTLYYDIDEMQAGIDSWIRDTLD